MRGVLWLMSTFVVRQDRDEGGTLVVNGGLPLNRDKNGAINIGTNFERLFNDKDPIRSMTDEDIAFHRATTCLACD